MEKELYKVSVIVPIYKVERFIVRCAISLLEQTLQEVEFIFVDDATPDGSIHLLQEVIERYPERKKQVKLIRHETNKGLPAARNSGLVVANGEYVFHCDSDDFVDLEMLEQLYRAAKEQDADIVWCDWWLSFEKNERYMKQPMYTTQIDALKGMLSGVMKFNVWNKLVRHDLYTKHHIFFPAGYGMGEDMTMILLFAYAKKIRYVPRAFYHYVKTNTSAFTRNQYIKNLIDLQYNVSRIEKNLQTLYGTSLNKEIAFLKLETKFPLLIMGSNSQQYKQWMKLYPESNIYICQNTYIPLRSRALEWLAWKKQWWLVRLYYWLVIRLIYGVIYK